MSYILDALKRADAERERGHVPGLHTHIAQPSAATPARTAWPATAWLMAVLPAVALMGAAWWWQADPLSTGLRTPFAAPVQTQPAAPTPPAAPPSPAPSGQPLARNAPTPAAMPLLAPARPDTPGPSARAEPGPSATSSSAAPESSAKPPPPTPVPRFAELSPQARAQLPVVAVSGSTYSQNPAHRTLIANGAVVQEGQEIAPGLVLETIGPRSAVLNHQGMRYSIGY